MRDSSRVEGPRTPCVTERAAGIVCTAPLGKRLASKIRSFTKETVENRVKPFFPLEELEARNTVLVEHDDFAIQRDK